MTGPIESVTGEGEDLTGRAVMRQDWTALTYVHWRVHPNQIAHLIPPQLSVDTFDGSGWVGLVPFDMRKVGAGRVHIPYFGNFAETNVRTYVTGPAGPGVWFHSLDASRLLPVVVARLVYRLPYTWSAMSIVRSGSEVIYRAQRRWPTAHRLRSLVALEVGDRVEEPTELDHFLTARWGLYTRLGGRLAYAQVAHEPWPLRSATLAALSDDFVAAAGYEISGAPEHVRYSPGVSVRVGRPVLLD